MQSGPPSRNQLEWKKVKTAIESCTKSYKPEIINWEFLDIRRILG